MSCSVFLQHNRSIWSLAQRNLILSVSSVYCLWTSSLGVLENSYLHLTSSRYQRLDDRVKQSLWHDTKQQPLVLYDMAQLLMNIAGHIRLVAGQADTDPCHLREERIDKSCRGS